MHDELPTEHKNKLLSSLNSFIKIAVVLVLRIAYYLNRKTAQRYSTTK